jgi:hypothetical protein
MSLSCVTGFSLSGSIFNLTRLRNPVKIVAPRQRFQPFVTQTSVCAWSLYIFEIRLKICLDFLSRFR